MAPLPADGRIKVRKDLAYESGGARLAFALYLPAGRRRVQAILAGAPPPPK